MTPCFHQLLLFFLEISEVDDGHATCFFCDVAFIEPALAESCPSDQALDEHMCAASA